jgi:hypothetical protein
MGCGENAGYRGSYVSLNATELRRFIIIEPVKKPDRRSDRSIVNELRMPRSRERNEGPDQSYHTLRFRTLARIGTGWPPRPASGRHHARPGRLASCRAPNLQGVAGKRHKHMVIRHQGNGLHG